MRTQQQKNTVGQFHSMNIDTKVLNKILAIRFNSTLKRLHVMIKLASSQDCKDGFPYANQ
jgi:hypothetical protein